MLYERRQNKQVLYVIPISSILGKLPLVPVGDTGTIPFSMRDELHEVDGAKGLPVTNNWARWMDAGFLCQSLGLIMVNRQRPYSIKVCKI